MGLNDAGCTRCPEPNQPLTTTVVSTRQELVQRCPACADDEVSLTCRACANDMTEETFCSVCVSAGLNDAGCARCPEPGPSATTTGAAGTSALTGLARCPTCADEGTRDSLSCRACYHHMSVPDFCNLCDPGGAGFEDAGCTFCPEHPVPPMTTSREPSATEQRCRTCAEDEVSLSCRACSNDVTEEAFCSDCASAEFNDAGCSRCPPPSASSTTAAVDDRTDISAAPAGTAPAAVASSTMAVASTSTTLAEESATTTTILVTAAEAMIDGEVMLEVPNAAAFVADESVVELLAAAIAASLDGVEPGMVEIVSVATPDTDGLARFVQRRLQTPGAVRVNYRVRVESEAEADRLSAELAAEAMPALLASGVTSEAIARGLPYEELRVRSVSAHTVPAPAPSSEPVSGVVPDLVTPAPSSHGSRVSLGALIVAVLIGCGAWAIAIVACFGCPTRDEEGGRGSLEMADRRTRGDHGGSFKAMGRTSFEPPSNWS